MRKLAILLALSLLPLLAVSSPAAASPLDKLTDADLAPYQIRRKPDGNPAETPDQAGLRFLNDLKARDPVIYAAVSDGLGYQIQAKERQEFARANKFVLAAYGVIWGILAVFALLVFLRQRRLGARIAELEAQLADEAGGSA